MRCSCCDVILTDSEATARFHSADEKAPRRYVEMCSKCCEHMPSDVKVIYRRDLQNSNEREIPTHYDLYDPFELGDCDDESW